MLLLHLLSSWRCPPALLSRLATPHPSSRMALLTLSWLIATSGLFQRAMRYLALPTHLVPLLPPFSQDLSSSPGARESARAAAESARHRQERTKLLRGGHHGWEGVEVAAQQLLAGLGAVRVRLKLLGALLEGRERLVAAVMEQLRQQQQSTGVLEQQQQLKCVMGQRQQQQQQGQQAHRRGVQPLTPYELLLAINPRLMQQHEAALSSACELLKQQLECAQHAQVRHWVWPKNM